MPMARAPRITVKLSHDKKVRSLAKKTLGSTRVGRAIRLPAGCRRSAGALKGSWLGGVVAFFFLGAACCWGWLVRFSFGCLWVLGWLFGVLWIFSVRGKGFGVAVPL